MVAITAASAALVAIHLVIALLVAAVRGKDASDTRAVLEGLVCDGGEGRAFFFWSSSRSICLP